MAPDTAIAPAPLTTPAAPVNARAITRVAAVRLEGVTKVYGSGRASVAALDTLTLDVEKGSFTCIVGTSGCGKTTVLNLIAGLDEPSAGTIEVTGRSALMFQESALFPWLTAAGNVELALRLRGVRSRGVAHARSSCSTASTSAASRPSARMSSPEACASASPSPRARPGRRRPA